MQDQGFFAIDVDDVNMPCFNTSHSYRTDRATWPDSVYPSCLLMGHNMTKSYVKTRFVLLQTNTCQTLKACITKAIK